MDTDEIVTQLIETSGEPGSFHRMYEQVSALPLEQQKEVYGRLTDATPNPTGDR